MEQSTLFNTFARRLKVLGLALVSCLLFPISASAQVGNYFNDRFIKYMQISEGEVALCGVIETTSEHTAYSSYSPFYVQVDDLRTWYDLNDEGENWFMRRRTIMGSTNGQLYGPVNNKQTGSYYPPEASVLSDTYANKRWCTLTKEEILEKYGSYPSIDENGDTWYTVSQIGDGTRNWYYNSGNNIGYQSQITLPSCIKKIAANTFRARLQNGNPQYGSCTAINLDSIEFIGSYAFAINSLDSIHLTCATLIESNAFQTSRNLKKVKLYHNIDNNDDNNNYQFSSSPAIEEVTFDTEVTRVPVGCFNACTGLITINIGNVETICANSFNGCTSLETVDLTGVSTLGNSCFSGCTSLHFTNLDLQNKNVGSSPFSGVSADRMYIKDTNITGTAILDGMVNSNIYIDGDTVASVSKFLNSSFTLDASNTIYVPCEVLNEYRMADGWRNIAAQIKGNDPGCADPENRYVYVDGVKYYTAIWVDDASTKTTTLIDLGSCKTAGSSLVIPSTWEDDDYTVTALGYASCQKTSFTSITIPETCKKVGACAFKENSNLTTMVNFDKVEEIQGDSAFLNCTALTTISLGADLHILPSKTFYNCRSLRNIDLSNISTFGDTKGDGSQFYQCYLLDDASLVGLNVAKIPAYTFYCCTSLTSVDLSNVGSLGATDMSGSSGKYGKNFSGCSSLRTVTLGSDIKEIPSYCFENCNQLTGIDLSNVETLGEYVSTSMSGGYNFYNCQRLKNVTMGNKIVILPSYSFYNCDSIKTIDLSSIRKFKNSMSGLSGYTSSYGFHFSNCDSLREVKLGGSMDEHGNIDYVSIGSNSFYGCVNLQKIDLQYVDSIGANAFAGTMKLNIHANLHNAKYIGSSSFNPSGLNTAWIRTLGDANESRSNVFNCPYMESLYLDQNDPTIVNPSQLLGSYSSKTAIFVPCTNVVSSYDTNPSTPNDKNPIEMYHLNNNWKNSSYWNRVYPMLHQVGGIEQGRKFSTFCFDKPIDFTGKTIKNTEHCIEGMLQYYLQPENNTAGFRDNRIEPLVVTGYTYSGGLEPNAGGDVSDESGSLTVANPGPRPAYTGILVRWHHDDEFNDASGLQEFYPLPPIRNASGIIQYSQSNFESMYPGVKSGTFVHEGEINSGARNKFHDKTYVDEDATGTRSYDETSGVYSGEGFSNLLIGVPEKTDSIYYYPWFYAIATDGDGHELYDEEDNPVLDTNNKSFDTHYKQFMLHGDKKRFPRCARMTENERMSGSWLRPYRAYLRLPILADGTTTTDGSGGATAAAPIKAYFYIDESNDGEATTISLKELTEGLTPEGVVYNMSGLKVSNHGLDGLAPGLYIMNGKKVVKK